MPQYFLTDFMVFQLRLLQSLEMEVPLEENLRAIGISTLCKLLRYCGAKAGMHVFTNSEMNELHILGIGNNKKSKQLAREETQRRYGININSLNPRSELPKYSRIAMYNNSNLYDLLSPDGDIRIASACKNVVYLFEEAVNNQPDEMGNVLINEGDELLIIPLGKGPYRRLGCLIMCGSNDELKKYCDDLKNIENLMFFRKGIEDIMITTFNNYYHMEPHTYLPSYYKVEHKQVAILCAKILDIDRISEVLNQRKDFEWQRAGDCLRKLVNRFSETASNIIERYHGRVDQLWGNGIIAVFGEYLDTQEIGAGVPCRRAVIAAADLVEEFQEAAKIWLEKDFEEDNFKKLHSELIDVLPVVVVDFGHVFFDYIGSSKRRVYMGVGDRVEFVNQLANVPMFTTNESNAPILISQSVYTWAGDLLQDIDGTQAGRVKKPRIITFPGKFIRYKIYELWPQNVIRFSP